MISALKPLIARHEELDRLYNDDNAERDLDTIGQEQDDIVESVFAIVRDNLDRMNNPSPELVKTSRTWSSRREAEAFVLGFDLGQSGTSCDAVIDEQEPQTVLVDCSADAEGDMVASLRDSCIPATNDLMTVFVQLLHAVDRSMKGQPVSGATAAAAVRGREIVEQIAPELLSTAPERTESEDTEKRLLNFARHVLRRLEADQDWDGDTMESIGGLAIESGLGASDDDGQFVVKL